ncbi:MAG: RNA-binding S4 domain-containing protein [Sutterellaceae bacterium]|nr:RNA-binding S4 domain-containing protein [Sutterellaceae bacterium]MDD7441017.1 RNA-binding S4 domain-containing protein [Sutterellaceae bacterium]MDY2867389.1 RNA-binding S4 domain-containing protein [Mesosutterella sp.]
MAEEKFILKGEFIKLDALLKAAGIAPTGGAAKEMIQEGRILVNGAKETRRGAKIRGGSKVEAEGSGRAILVEPDPALKEG